VWETLSATQFRTVHVKRLWTELPANWGLLVSENRMMFLQVHQALAATRRGRPCAAQNRLFPSDCRSNTCSRLISASNPEYRGAIRMDV
jgi:hypothetical protein